MSNRKGNLGKAFNEDGVFSSINVICDLIGATVGAGIVRDGMMIQIGI